MGAGGAQQFVAQPDKTESARTLLSSANVKGEGKIRASNFMMCRLSFSGYYVQISAISRQALAQFSYSVALAGDYRAKLAFTTFPT
jgi:hypothetical protein